MIRAITEWLFPAKKAARLKAEQDYLHALREREATSIAYPGNPCVLHSLMVPSTIESARGVSAYDGQFDVATKPFEASAGDGCAFCAPSDSGSSDSSSSCSSGD